MMIDKCRFAPRGDDCAVRFRSPSGGSAITRRAARSLPQRSRQAKRSDRNGPIQWPIRYSRLHRIPDLKSSRMEEQENVMQVLCKECNKEKPSNRSKYVWNRTRLPKMRSELAPTIAQFLRSGERKISLDPAVLHADCHSVHCIERGGLPFELGA